MHRSRIVLQSILNNHPILNDSDYEFLYLLQQALLLALREQGHLSAMQYRHAEEKLRHQRQMRARTIVHQEGDQT